MLTYRKKGVAKQKERDLQIDAKKKALLKTWQFFWFIVLFGRIFCKDKHSKMQTLFTTCVHLNCFSPAPSGGPSFSVFCSKTDPIQFQFHGAFWILEGSTIFRLQVSAPFYCDLTVYLFWLIKRQCASLKNNNNLKGKEENSLFRWP